MIYLDSAALVKLVVTETGSAPLARWLADRLETPRVSSALVEVEVPRAVGRSSPGTSAAVRLILRSVVRVDMNASVRATAACLPPSTLRSLDAVHLATALLLGTELRAFVSYDKRLLDAARAAGLPVASPGG